MLLEKTRTAHHKVCGEFISADARNLISDLGVDIWALEATEITALSFACGVQVPRIALPFTAAGLSRFCLDEALLRAAQNAGAEVVRGGTVTSLDVEATPITVHTSGQKFAAASVVLATGKHDLIPPP